eukprot:scaffold423820_cov17-Prasinocladus_malaysianus.AAC.1
MIDKGSRLALLNGKQPRHGCACDNMYVIRQCARENGCSRVEPFSTNSISISQQDNASRRLPAGCK